MEVETNDLYTICLESREKIVNVYEPDFTVFRNLPIIEALNIEIIYSLAYGYQTAKGRHETYEYKNPLPNIRTKPVGSNADDVLLIFVAQAEHVTAAGLAKYGRAVNEMPIRFINVALSCAAVKISPGPYPAGISLFSLDLDRWISAIKNNFKEWEVVQERGELVKGAYRDGDMVILAFDTFGMNYPADAYYIDGIRMSAEKLLHQLEAIKAKIRNNQFLIENELKVFRTLWRAMKAMFEQ